MNPSTETSVAHQARLDDEIAAFAGRITPAIERWQYAAKVSRKRYYSRRFGGWVDGLNDKSVPALSRVLGVRPWTVKSRVARICHEGMDGAIAFARDFDGKYSGEGRLLRPYFEVGTLPAWCCGHVYFARVKTHPHVLKIGFSRRVRERLDDISSKNKVGLVLLNRDHLKVGTQADEHWWHASWAPYRIDGEWFFDPKSSERTLPDFLAEFAKKEAA